jgi:serine/threonine protein kinase
MVASSMQGRTLGKYRVLEPLGRGGMARVYRGYHPQLDRYVAIKVLRSDLVEEEEFLARFRREAQAVAALRHPNIVQVYDFDVEGESYYMVMELLEGDTLKARLSDYRVRGERMPLGEVVRVMLDVLDGLSYAHREGMIHRDIKPANVILTKHGQAVVADFGIAKIIGGTLHTASGALMGTLNYIAPEQGLEGKSDARSDIYSLGIVLYEILTGHTPFDADTPLAVLMKHLNDPLPLPRQIDETIPEPFERVVLKALAKQPDDRYQSAEEMSQSIRQAAEEVGIELPSRISLPLSFTTAEAPSEQVAVFSGTVREQIEDVDFADDETEVSIGQGLALEGVAAEEEPRAPRTSRRAARREAQRARQQQKKAARLQERQRRQQELAAQSSGPLGRALLQALGLVLGANLLAVMWSGILDNWGLFRVGWPMELLLVGLGLTLIMRARGLAFLLVPTGIILGNGLLFTYYSLTGNWEHWAFLWPLELLVVGGSIVGAIQVRAQEDSTARVARLGRLFIRVAALALVIIFVLTPWM